MEIRHYGKMGMRWGKRANYQRRLNAREIRKLKAKKIAALPKIPRIAALVAATIGLIGTVKMSNYIKSQKADVAMGIINVAFRDA